MGITNLSPRASVCNTSYNQGFKEEISSKQVGSVKMGSQGGGKVAAAVAGAGRTGGSIIGKNIYL